MEEKSRRCVRQLGLMQDSDGDTTNTSRWSSPATLSCDGNDSSDCEDKRDRTPHVQPSVMWQRHKQTGSKKGKKLQGKQNVLKLPPVRPLPSVQPAGMTCIMELKSQVRDLQLQLTETRTENKLLKRVQHRHMVALQHFQDSEGSFSQVREILVKHNNEAKALQTMLHQTRTSRDSLARQLQAAETKLQNTKAALQHLQLLHQDQSLLEREELSLKLAEASAELEDRDKRVQNLERNLELVQASFKRQLATEQRKLEEARKISCYLEDDVYRLTGQVQNRERELEKQNIYYHSSLKGPSKKGRKNKMVQTNESFFTSKCTLDFLETEFCESEKLQQQEDSVDWCCNKQGQESLVGEKPERKGSADVLSENLPEETSTGQSVFSEDNSSEKSYLEGRSDHTEDGCATGSEAVETLQELVEQQETEHESSLSPDETKHQGKEDRLPNTRRHYTFKQSVENLHSGRPAYSRAETAPASCTGSARCWRSSGCLTEQRSSGD